MQKTEFEECYIRLIINRILHFDKPLAKRSVLLYDFHLNSSLYFENLCDALYNMSSSGSNTYLWLKNNGDVYVSVDKKGSEDSLLISSSVLPVFEGDLDEHLAVVWSGIRELTASAGHAV